MPLRIVSSKWYVMLALLVVGCGSRHDHDKDAIQGEWAVVSGESRSGSGGITGESITIAGDTFTHWCGGIKFNAAFSLNSAKFPTQIDFKNAIGTVDPGTSRGSLENRTLLGIYEITGDQMRLCIDESGSGRPSRFAGNGPNVMLILTRK